MGHPVAVHQSVQQFYKSLTIYIFDMKNAMVSAWESELRLVSKSLITLFEWEKGEAKDLLKSCVGLYWQKPGVSCFLCGLTIELIEQRGEYLHFLQPNPECFSSHVTGLDENQVKFINSLRWQKPPFSGIFQSWKPEEG